MKRFILIRHGRTEWNRLRRFQGHQDVPMNQQGVQQAKAVGEYLRTEKIHHIYTSDLLRAKQTVAYIRKFHRETPVHETSDLREGRGGILEGKLLSDLLGDSELQSLTTLKTVFDYKGESLQEMQKRMINKMYDISEILQDGETAIIVSHGGPLRVFLAKIQGISLKESVNISIENCSISEASFATNKWQVVRINSKHFLNIASMKEF